ncbi:hypothetical protein B566_EDAN005440 [Ephemera danica]|nr:hypothetical protein B566_EDAN005440 [Ephemera danica]
MPENYCTLNLDITRYIHQFHHRIVCGDSLLVSCIPHTPHSKMCTCDSSPAISHRMGDWINYFNDPLMVLKIQNYFGIYRRRQTNGSVDKLRTSDLSSSSSSSENSEVLTRRKNITGKTQITEDEEDTGISSESETETSEYVVNNKIWYYLFCFGTILGDEIFYASFIPFWFWNIDGAVGRRVVLVWAIIMYIGQGIKDIIRWPRPACPPAVRVQKKWALEYGMPSTHAMVAACMPFSVLLYTMDRYQYSMTVGLIVAFAWCSIVCVSRVYLGMHSVLDVIVGLILAVLLMIPLIPLVDALDKHLLTGLWSPYIVLGSSILLVACSPCGDRWTPTRGDTAVVTGVTVGIQIGAWMNYKLGFMKESLLQPPYSIIWPTYQMMGLLLLRTVLGFCCMIATRAFFKWASYVTACALLRLDRRDMKHRDISNRRQTIVELSYKFITYFAVGIDTAYLLPNLFRIMGIERPTFYTEI